MNCNHLLTGEALETLPLKPRTKLSIVTIIYYCLGSATHNKRMK